MEFEIKGKKYVLREEDEGEFEGFSFYDFDENFIKEALVINCENELGKESI